MPSSAPWLTVIGIGEDGDAGLGERARDAIDAAEILVGSERQLALVRHARAVRVPLPSPLLAHVDALIAAHRGRRVVFLASGDPLLHGIGETLAQRVGADEMRVLPAPSAFALACAHLRWAQTDIALVSAVARPLANVRRELAPGRRIVVYSEDGATSAHLAALLCGAGFGASTMHVFERLGGPFEQRRDGVADSWTELVCDALNVVAIDCTRAPAAPAFATLAGLPDEAFEHDGALTKREVRAATLARLAPQPGHLLWDVGAGSGSIGIEWMRAHASCRAIAFERDPERAARIARNAQALGVPALRVVLGCAPDAFPADDAERGDVRPDAAFVGGGLNADGTLLATCWQALRPGGRLVVNVMTIDGERRVADAHERYGGELARIAVSRAVPIGGVLGWRPLTPVTQWAVTKPYAVDETSP